jgi:hypothetical protein
MNPDIAILTDNVALHLVCDVFHFERLESQSFESLSAVAEEVLLFVNLQDVSMDAYAYESLCILST